ncbi:hypothetical protein CGLO_02469 [Colletotrichum gloeosporioides Cg-14]|uniref:Uncharacterized protein n=1 Tax=Colletotrichum gloeosporioides (strain Cg-14) TaxID=1237896 RepID=T0KY70_COLGC|nr:hypothetical protein CGLO_02469 [Colletotrichum gloeosporioides Cg-14]
MSTYPESRAPDFSRGVELADEEVMDRHRDSAEIYPPMDIIVCIPLGDPSAVWGADPKTKVRQRSNYSNLWNTLIKIMTRSKSRATVRKSHVLKKSLEVKESKEKNSSFFESYVSVPVLDEQLEEVEQKENSEAILTQILAKIVTLTSSLFLSSTAIKRSLSYGGDIVEVPWASAQGLGGHDPGKLERDLNDILSMSNPSPVALGIAMLAYGAGTSTMYHLNRNDRFQDAVLTMGISIGLIAGILVGHKFEAIILHVLPWAVFLALSLSTLGHRIARAVARKRETFEGDSIV